MKKLSLIFALVFAVGFVMAQKTTWVTQSGTSNVATINQDAGLAGGYDQNAIFAVQSGNYNALTTLQSGKDNYLELAQSGTGNSATMEQATKATLPAGGVNNAFISQGGVSNAATLIQGQNPLDALGYNHSTNTAHATQSGQNGSYVLNQGMLGNGYDPKNTQFLTQSGISNTADLNQKGYTNYSEVLQSGNYNAADLDQADAAMNSSVIWDKSFSTQIGTSNLLDVYQHGNPGLQEATSNQNGVSNKTNIKQLSWNKQDVVSQQSGTGDVINVTQIN